MVLVCAMCTPFGNETPSCMAMTHVRESTRFKTGELTFFGGGSQNHLAHGRVDMCELCTCTRWCMMYMCEWEKCSCRHDMSCMCVVHCNRYQFTAHSFVFLHTSVRLAIDLYANYCESQSWIQHLLIFVSGTLHLHQGQSFALGWLINNSFHVECAWNMLASKVYYFARVFDEPRIGNDEICTHPCRYKDRATRIKHASTKRVKSKHKSTQLVIKKSLHVRTWHDHIQHDTKMLTKSTNTSG